MINISNFVAGHTVGFWLSLLLCLVTLALSSFCFFVIWEGPWSAFKGMLYVCFLMSAASFLDSGIDFDRRIKAINLQGTESK